MKTLILFAMIALIAGCSKDNNYNSLNGKWKVISYADLQTQQTFTKTSPESGLAGHSYYNTDIIVTLKKGDQSLHLQGRTVTNEVSGDFQLLANDQLHTISFGGTKVGEPNWGNWFWDAMNTTSSYILNNSTFVIYYNHGKQSVTLARE